MKIHDDEALVLAQYLPADDRRIIVLRHGGSSNRYVAYKTGKSLAFVRRRVARLMVRLSSPEFQFVVRRIDGIPEQMRLVARLLFVHGRSLRLTAELTDRSLHQVRTEKTAIAAIVLAS